jgi:hypothetical protein
MEDQTMNESLLGIVLAFATVGVAVAFVVAVGMYQVRHHRGSRA